MAPRPLPPINIQSRTGQYTERSKGLHLSDITNDLLRTMDPEKYGRTDDLNDVKYGNFLGGLIFERALELAWLDKEMADGHRPELIRPGEVTVDGITGTPDAFDTLVGRPEEYKFTKKSCRQPITDHKFWIYWVQLKAYAFMTASMSGALYVMHVNGNYSWKDEDPESGYVIKPWEDDWSQLQLEENWFMLLQHARKRGWL